MQDTELLLSLAEIAGVFVGFGALIAVRSGGASDVAEVAYIRGVVSMGMLTVVAALAPVILGRYGAGGHQVWALSGAVVLVGWFAWVLAMARTPEYRANIAAEIEADKAARSWWIAAASLGTFVAYVTANVLLPIVIILGVGPDHEAALYVTLVALILVGAAWALLSLVFSQRRSPTV